MRTSLGSRVFLVCEYFFQGSRVFKNTRQPHELGNLANSLRTRLPDWAHCHELQAVSRRLEAAQHGHGRRRETGEICTMLGGVRCCSVIRGPWHLLDEPRRLGLRCWAEVNFGCQHDMRRRWVLHCFCPLLQTGRRVEGASTTRTTCCLLTLLCHPVKLVTDLVQLRWPRHGIFLLFAGHPSPAATASCT